MKKWTKNVKLVKPWRISAGKGESDATVYSSIASYHEKTVQEKVGQAIVSFRRKQKYLQNFLIV